MYKRLFTNKFIINSTLLKRKLTHTHSDTKKLNIDKKISNSEIKEIKEINEKYSMILTDLEEIKLDLDIIKLLSGFTWFISFITLYNS
jgi:hypothetical protein